MNGNHFDYCLGSSDTGLKKKLTAMLAEAGFSSSGEAKSVPEFLRLLRLKSPWLAIIDTRIPPGRLKQLASVIEEDALAAALFIDPGSKDLSGYMVLKWPVEKNTLVAVAKALCLEFGRKKQLRRKIDGLECKLKERMVIDQAKGILIRDRKLDEESAYRFLQKKSMDLRISIVKAAMEIITGEL